MVSIDKMQEEVDKATETLAKLNEIDVYALLLRIKYAENRDEVLDRELEICKLKLENIWRIDIKIMKDMEEMSKS